MARAQDRLDGKRGPLPEIHALGNGVVYVMTPPGSAANDRLVVRCDAAGDVWISIRSDK